MVKKEFYATRYKNIEEMAYNYAKCRIEQKDVQRRLTYAVGTLIQAMAVRNATEEEMARATQYSLALYDGYGFDFETPIVRDVEDLFEKYLLTPLTQEEILKIRLMVASGAQVFGELGITF